MMVAVTAAVAVMVAVTAAVAAAITKTSKENNRKSTLKHLPISFLFYIFDISSSYWD
jgi:VIT1/CCC1 family predicted Fe2+/Mn2+ transporter